MFLFRECSGEVCEWKVCLLIWALFWLPSLKNMLTKKCAPNETMECSGNGEHRVYICYFHQLEDAVSIPESIGEMDMKGKFSCRYGFIWPFV